MQLAEIFPHASIEEFFTSPVKITQRNRSKIAEIAKLKSGCMLEIAGGAWDRFVTENPKCDRQALSDHFQKGNTKTYLAMERLTGLKVLHDISYTTAEIEDPTAQEGLVSELLLAVVYPGALRISDVTFRNTHAPILEMQPEAQFRKYKGLGLLPELLARCEEFCRINGLSEILLTAAYSGLLPLFKKHGFIVENTYAAKIALQYGIGIPMTKKAKWAM
jgi:hypothetical protein